jgi:paraquat-inducible protein B
VFHVKASRLGSITLGSPVFFRDLDAGEVLGWDIADMAESVTIHVFVRAPYDNYVHDESRFWNASGLSVKLGADGVQFQVESLRALVLGGIAFDTPAGESATPVSLADHVFPLFENRQSAAAASYNRKIPVISYFPGSVRGLAAGFEVTMHGLVVGHVVDVRSHTILRRMRSWRRSAMRSSRNVSLALAQKQCSRLRRMRPARC